jgi:hypothetical protein
MGRWKLYDFAGMRVGVVKGDHPYCCCQGGGRGSEKLYIDIDLDPDIYIHSPLSHPAQLTGYVFQQPINKPLKYQNQHMKEMPPYLSFPRQTPCPPACLPASSHCLPASSTAQHINGHA